MTNDTAGDMWIYPWADGRLTIHKDGHRIIMTRAEVQALYQKLATILGVGVITVFPSPASPSQDNKTV